MELSTIVLVLPSWFAIEPEGKGRANRYFDLQGNVKARSPGSLLTIDGQLYDTTKSKVRKG